MSLTEKRLFAFGPFQLDPAERLLLRDRHTVPLPPKAHELLLVLVSRAGHLVTKEELLQEVWPGTFVEEGNLSYTVSVLRKALGDDHEPFGYIETVAKRGYRFKGDVIVTATANARGIDVTDGSGHPQSGAGIGHYDAGRRRWHWIAWLAAASVMTAVIAATYWMTTSREEETSPPIRLALNPPSGVAVENAQISPDGRRVVFRGRDGAGVKLWVHALDSGLTSPLAGTDGAHNPFWAPDSEQVAFEVGGAIKKISLSGGAPQTVCQARNVAGTWSRDDVILFQVSATYEPFGAQPGALFSVPASGGRPVAATRLDSSKGELRHASPHFLPDGRHFLYVVHAADKATSGLYVKSLDSNHARRLLDIETGAVYAAPGYLLFSRDGAVVAQRFDVGNLQLRGDTIPIAHDADYETHVGLPQFSTSSRMTPGFGLYFTTGLLGAGTFSASQTGVLAYSLLEPYLYQFVWLDREGRHMSEMGPAGAYRTFDISPDGRRLVVSRGAVDRANLWVFEFERNATSRVTFGPRFEFDPRWLPDGRRVAATVVEDGNRRVAEIGLDGRESVLVDRSFFLDDLSRDGRFLLGHAARGLEAVPLSGDRSPIRVRAATASNTTDQARFSPDGRLVAYQSAASGRYEVYLERFPSTGERWQVSTAGGFGPVWRRDGRELYFSNLEGMLFAAGVRPTGEATVPTEAENPAGQPQALFTLPIRALSHDVEHFSTVDGSRFLVLKPIDRPQRPIHVIVNWPAAIGAQRIR